MGNWNRRWIPRKKYNYQEPPASLPRPHRTEFIPPGIWEKSVPLWERNFCSSMGIPWQKIVVAKRYIYCHDNVVKWDDSAGEEAFHNAKNRFWAEINGLPCETSLSDPDMYIDEIDWDPDIDPELMLDLDREYFNPDEADKIDKVEITIRKAHNSVPGHTLGWDDKNSGNGDNPLECSHVQGNGALKDEVQGWNQRDNSGNLENADNPWEHRYTQDDGALKDNAWGGSGDKSWGWNQGLNCTRQSDLYNNCDNPWDGGCQTVTSVKKKGWGEVGNKSWGRNRWEKCVHGSRNLHNGDTPWEDNFIQGNGVQKDRGWRDCGDNSWRSKRWENQSNEPKHLDSKRPSTGGGRAFNGGCRKREGSQQHASRYKSSRFQGDEYGIGHQWRKGRTQNRVLSNEKYLEEVFSRTPLRRLGDPTEVSSLVAFQSLPSSSYITGQIICVDGGMSINGIYPIHD